MSALIFYPLILSEWEETRDTLQKYCRMVGAIREAISIPLPHSYQTNLLLSSKGFTTSLLPKNINSPESTFEVILDIENQRLIIESCFGEPMRIALTGQSLNALCDETCSLMSDIGIAPPLEKPSFLEGKRGRFDPEPLLHYWYTITSVNQLLNKIKTELRNDTSPVQLRPDDLAFVLTWFGKNFQSKNNFGGQQVEFGFSTGDSVVQEAYFYISTFPDKEKIEELTEKECLLVVNGRPKKAILQFNNLISAEDKEKVIMKFFRRAAAAFNE